MTRFKLCTFIIAVTSSITVSHAQGFLPHKSSSSTAVTESEGPLLIGAKVPETLTVRDTNGKKRALLTYKSGVEIMVAGFFSSQCPPKESRWNEIGRFYRDYKDWGVAFIAINAGQRSSQDELMKQMAKADLHFPLVGDEESSVAHVLKVEAIPELVILDESGNLRYRGPVGKDARAAIEAIIGHMVPVPNPEPPNSGGCPAS